MALLMRLYTACFSRRSSPTTRPTLGAQDSSSPSSQLRARSPVSTCSAEQRAQVDRRQVELHVPGLDGGYVQAVVDERPQAMRGLDEAAVILPLPLVDRTRVWSGKGRSGS